LKEANDRIDDVDLETYKDTHEIKALLEENLVMWRQQEEDAANAL